MWEPSPGMIYPMLRNLESEGYITGWWAEPDRRSIKHYKLTPEGYEHYKKIGPVMQRKYKAGNISGKDFEEWIESTKLR